MWGPRWALSSRRTSSLVTAQGVTQIPTDAHGSAQCAPICLQCSAPGPPANSQTGSGRFTATPGQPLLLALVPLLLGFGKQSLSSSLHPARWYHSLNPAGWGTVQHSGDHIRSPGPAARVERPACYSEQHLQPGIPCRHLVNTH